MLQGTLRHDLPMNRRHREDAYGFGISVGSLDSMLKFRRRYIIIIADIVTELTNTKIAGIIYVHLLVVILSL